MGGGLEEERGPHWSDTPPLMHESAEGVQHVLGIHFFVATCLASKC